ncbi:MAG: glycosyltransferase family 39 protein, partial [Myxococcota bacterium]
MTPRLPGRAVTGWARVTGLLAAALVVVAVGQNVALVLRDAPLPNYDGHYARSVNFSTWLATLDPTFLERHGEPVFFDHAGDPTRYPLYGAYPPVVYLVTAAVYALGGVSVAHARLAVVLFGLLLLPAAWTIGRALGGRVGGLATLALAACAPVALHTSRMYVLDYPQAAVTAAAVAAALRSDGFRHRGWSLAAGAALALALLTKWSTVYYVTVPLLAVAVALPGRDRRAWATWGVGAGLVAWVGLAGVAMNALCRTPDRWIGAHHWVLAVLLGVIAPAALAVARVSTLERPTERAVRVGNFVLAGALALSLAGPWYVWALGDLRANLQVNAAHFATLGVPALVGLGTGYLAHVVLGGAVLLPLGLAAAVRARDATSLLFAANLVAVLALLLHTGDARNFLAVDIQSRLSAALAVFAAPLAGAWLGRMGRPGAVVTAGLFAASLAFVTGWIHSPGATARAAPFWGAHAAVFVDPPAQRPDSWEVAAPDALLTLLAANDRPDRRWEHVYVVASRTLRPELNVDDLYVRALLRADRIVAFDRLSPGVDQLRYEPMFRAQQARLATLDWVL